MPSFIQKIEIKNFRSIERCELSDINSILLLVGRNDSGKSNLLKALNLFFNNETDHNTPFSFEDDFCRFSKVTSKKASEISITLTIKPPDRFLDGEVFEWKKIWRKNSQLPVMDSIQRGGKDLLPKTKIPEWARKIVYRYIPAIKSESYFSDLRKQIYKTLSLSIQEKLLSASSQLIDTIAESTVPLTTSVHKNLGFDNDIVLPTDLTNLFEALDFSTRHNDKDISLKKRGDGIKIRYIPGILHFLHKEGNRVAAKGAIKTSTIWGYEEPENNLDLMASFDKAEELASYSEDIQILITTHSPAFYYLSKQKSLARTYIVSQRSGKSLYEKLTDSLHEGAEAAVGMLPLVAPYINEKMQEIKVLNSRVRNLESEMQRCNTLYVEGNTDKIIIEHLFERIGVVNFRIITEKSAGADFVRDMCLAAAVSRSVADENFQYLGLVDYDDAGKAAKDKYDAAIKALGRKAHERKVGIVQIRKPKHLTGIFNEGLRFQFGIEELFPGSVWRMAEAAKILGQRDYLKFIDVKNLENISASEYIELNFNEEQCRYIKMCIPDENKERFAKFVRDNNLDIKSFEGLARSLPEEVFQAFQSALSKGNLYDENRG